MSGRRFAALTAEAMTADQRRVAAEILGGPRAENTTLLRSAGGEIGGPFNALLRSPLLADRAQRLGEAVRFNSTLPKTLIEVAILLTARRWTAQFEWYAHERIALEAGLDPAIPAAIATGTRPAALDHEQAAVYEFVTELLDTGGVSDAAFATATDAFGEAGVVELVTLVGYYTLVSFLLNVDRHPLPDGTEPPLR